ncbi:hypothetical protein Plhal304r1_c027g0090531 [Plasmopara halstedii]
MTAAADENVADSVDSACIDIQGECTPFFSYHRTVQRHHIFNCFLKSKDTSILKQPTT